MSSVNTFYLVFKITFSCVLKCTGTAMFLCINYILNFAVIRERNTTITLKTFRFTNNISDNNYFNSGYQSMVVIILISVASSTDLQYYSFSWKLCDSSLKIFY